MKMKTLEGATWFDGHVIVPQSEFQIVHREGKYYAVDPRGQIIGEIHGEEVSKLGNTHSLSSLVPEIDILRIKRKSVYELSNEELRALVTHYRDTQKPTEKRIVPQTSCVVTSEDVSVEIKPNKPIPQYPKTSPNRSLGDFS